jgi:hypothetical protein
MGSDMLTFGHIRQDGWGEHPHLNVYGRYLHSLVQLAQP